MGPCSERINLRQVALGTDHPDMSKESKHRNAGNKDHAVAATCVLLRSCVCFCALACAFPSSERFARLAGLL